MVPSVVKIKKGNVEYTSKVDIAQYTIKELTHRAMLDVGRYITANVRKRLRAHFPFTAFHKAPMRYQYWFLKREGHLLLGIENIKRGAVTAWWADQLELDKFVTPPRGSRKQKREDDPAEGSAKKRKRRRSRSKLPGTPNNPRRHILETFVKTHIDKIVEIESQYLSKIDDEDAAVALAAATEDMEVLRGDEN